MNNATLIVAGGMGSRMRSEVPKQFLKIGKEPLLMHTLRRFFEFDHSMLLILVLPSDQKQTWQELVSLHDFQIPHQLIDGGPTRYHSVKNGLACIPDHCMVAIHDGVRPFVSLQTIHRCFACATDHGNAIPVISVNESLRQSIAGISKVIDRDSIRIVQTPQVFRSEIIKKAYEQPWDASITDDASLLEKMGFTINLVEGNRENIKITDPFDLKLAEAMLT